jgi:hypothetical protein
MLFRGMGLNAKCVLRRRNLKSHANRALYNGGLFDGFGRCC